MIIRNNITACATCRGLSEGAGVNVQNILTRNSERIRAQQHTNEGDIILPHKFDVASQNWIPNPDFVDRYAEMLPTYFTEEELVKHGYSKADRIFEAKAVKEAEHAREMDDVEFVGDDGVKMAEVVEGL